MEKWAEFMAKMKREPGGSEQEIADFETRLRLSLPDDYKSVLRYANGAAGPVGNEELHLFSIHEVLDVKARFQEYIEGLVIFGSDGGGEAYVLDPAHGWSVGMTPWIPIGRKELRPLGRTLIEFFTILKNDQRLGRI